MYEVQVKTKEEKQLETVNKNKIRFFRQNNRQIFGNVHVHRYVHEISRKSYGVKKEGTRIKEELEVEHTRFKTISAVTFAQQLRFSKLSYVLSEDFQKLSRKQLHRVFNLSWVFTR